jgi:omega-amidase
MKIALFQMDVAWEDKRRNFKKVASLAAGLKERQVDLICLPELFSTGYTMEPAPLAERLDGETPTFLSELARENGTDVVGSFIEKTAGKPRNAAIVFDKSGELVADYAKIHQPRFIGEHECYEPGDELTVFELGGTKLAVVICYDLRFPELFRGLLYRGVKGVFVIASWPAERIAHWDPLLVARAIENQFFVMGVNRVGSSPIGSYPGHSVVVDPWGGVVAAGKENREEVLVTEVDFGLVDKVREKLPVLEDRRF